MSLLPVPGIAWLLASACANADIGAIMYDYVCENHASIKESRHTASRFERPGFY